MRQNTRYCVLAVCLVAVALFAPTVRAAMTCTAQSSPRNLRSLGAAELVGEIVLTCRGGDPASTGNDIPRHQVLVAFNTDVTSRELVESGDFYIGWTEALLVVDEPDATQQRPCAPPLPEPAKPNGENPPDEETCFAVKGEAGAPNVFQGRPLQSNVVLFPDVPIDPPGADGVRTLRLVNLRVNAAAEIEDGSTTAPATALKPVRPVPVIAAVEVFEPNGNRIAIENPELSVGVILPTMSFELRTRDDLPVSAAEPALQMTPSTMTRLPNSDDVFLIRFSEALPESFRRRNAGTNTHDPLFVSNQATPGANYRTETGFYNLNFPRRRGLNRAGLGDSGTRFLVNVNGIPNGVRLWVSPRDVESGTTGYSVNAPKALLTHADAQGIGPFVSRPAFEGPMVEIAQFEGSVYFVYEVVSTDPDAIEDITFSIALSSDGNASLGEAELTAAIVPVAKFDEDPNDGEQVTPAVPSFVPIDPEPDPVQAFAVVPALPSNRLVSVSAASYQGSVVARGSIVAAFGTDLATKTVVAELELDDSLGGTSVEVIDSRGVLRSEKLFAVSAGQVNFLLSPETALGPAVVSVFLNDRLKATGVLQVDALSPALFSANGDGAGVAAGQSARAAGSTPVYENLATLSGNRFVSAAIDLGASGDQVFLVLYGTGFGGTTTPGDLTLTIGGVAVPVLYAGPQKQFAGLDQINVGPLPRLLEGRGEVEVVLGIGGRSSNRVEINLR